MATPGPARGESPEIGPIAPGENDELADSPLDDLVAKVVDLQRRIDEHLLWNTRLSSS